MTLRFCDGFDHYTAAQALRKWTAMGVGGSAGTINASGRFTGSSFLRLSNSSFGVSKTLDAQGTWVLGVAFRMGALPATVEALLTLVDAATTQVDLRVLTDGTLRVTRNGTTLGTSSYALLSGVWYYLEWKVVIHGSAGSYEVRVGGSSKLSASSQNTQASANATANQVRVGASALTAGSLSSWDFDDFYACDGQGSVNNDFLGDVRVETLYPSGAGTNTQFTPSAGSNWAAADDATPNDDTDYVEDSAAGHKDTYAFADLSSTPSAIKGVQTVLCARKTDAGSRSVAAVTRSSSADYDGATVSLADSYQFLTEVRETDPATAAAWAAAGVNGAEFGVKLVS